MACKNLRHRKCQINFSDFSIYAEHMSNSMWARRYVKQNASTYVRRNVKTIVRSIISRSAKQMPEVVFKKVSHWIAKNILGEMPGWGSLEVKVIWSTSRICVMNPCAHYKSTSVVAPKPSQSTHLHAQLECLWPPADFRNLGNSAKLPCTKVTPESCAKRTAKRVWLVSHTWSPWWLGATEVEVEGKQESVKR